MSKALHEQCLCTYPANTIEIVVTPFPIVGHRELLVNQFSQIEARTCAGKVYVCFGLITAEIVI